jgi:apolipoprotein N-acyltransferase
VGLRKPRESIASDDLRRVVAVAACCLLAAVSPFYAGFSAAVLGLVPLALAIWIVMRSEWSSRTRVITSVAVPVVTIALLIGLLAVVLRYYNN